MCFDTLLLVAALPLIKLLVLLQFRFIQLSLQISFIVPLGLIPLDCLLSLRFPDATPGTSHLNYYIRRLYYQILQIDLRYQSPGSTKTNFLDSYLQVSSFRNLEREREIATLHYFVLKQTQVIRNLDFLSSKLHLRCYYVQFSRLPE